MGNPGKERFDFCYDYSIEAGQPCARDGSLPKRA